MQLNGANGRSRRRLRARPTGVAPFRLEGKWRTRTLTGVSPHAGVLRVSALRTWAISVACLESFVLPAFPGEVVVHISILIAIGVGLRCEHLEQHHEFAASLASTGGITGIHARHETVL
jgi:hypothetical protein